MDILAIFWFHVSVKSNHCVLIQESQKVNSHTLFRRHELLGEKEGPHSAGDRQINMRSEEKSP